MKHSLENLAVMLSSDGDIDARIEVAKSAAKRLLTGDYNNLQEAELLLRWNLANFWKKPLFHPMWEDYTLEDYVVEWEFVSHFNKPEEVKIKEAAIENKEELDDMFADWDKEDSWENVQSELSPEEFSEIEKRFMETGEFKEK